MENDIEESLQPEPLSLEDQLKDMRAQVESYKPLESFRKALEEDPTQIYNLQAALAKSRQPVPLEEEDTYRAPSNQNQLPPLSDDPLDLLSPANRRTLEENAIVDPLGTAKVIASLTAKHSRMQIERQAAPMIESQAYMLLESFKGRMAMEDPQYYKQILPEFNKMMKQVAGNIKVLASMSHEIRENELSLRWNAARGKVYSNLMNAPRKTEPLLTSGDSPHGAPPGGSLKAKSMFETDPAMAAMAKRFKFTPAQIAEIEGYN